MSFGGIKDYTIIHLDFRTSTYYGFSYKKDRRLTARQMWKFIRSNNPSITGFLGPKSTIFDYDVIINQLGLNKKYCDRLVTFEGFN